MLPVRRGSFLRFPENRHRTVVGTGDLPHRVGCDDRSDQGDQDGSGRDQFYAPHVAYETETNKVFVSGELKSQGPSSKPDIKPRTNEFIIAIKNYRPRLEFIDVHPDDSTTLERMKVLQSQESSHTMRKICSPLALLLIISKPLSAEELAANALPILPPVTSNTLEAMPSVNIAGMVTASPPLQDELPVDAKVLKALSSP